MSSVTAIAGGPASDTRAQAAEVRARGARQPRAVLFWPETLSS
jgi:hypothetical protein